jgi:hypothetical protein
VFSRFRRDVDENCALLGYYAPSSGNPLPTFRDNVSVPSSRIKKSKKQRGPLKMGPIRCPETSVKDYHSMVRNSREKRRSQAAVCWSLYFIWTPVYVQVQLTICTVSSDLRRIIRSVATAWVRECL